jgi:hypothetical protein
MTNSDHERLRTSSGPAVVSHAHRPSVEVISEAVIATYIHDISARHRRLGAPRTAAPSRRRDGKREGAAAIAMREQRHVRR